VSYCSLLSPRQLRGGEGQERHKPSAHARDRNVVFYLSAAREQNEQKLCLPFGRGGSDAAAAAAAATATAA